MFHSQIESKSIPVKTTKIHKLHSTTTSTEVFLVNFRFILMVHIGSCSLSPKASTASQELTIKYTSYLYRKSTSSQSQWEPATSTQTQFKDHSRGITTESLTQTKSLSQWHQHYVVMGPLVPCILTKNSDNRNPR